MPFELWSRGGADSNMDERLLARLAERDPARVATHHETSQRYALPAMAARPRPREHFI
jgi:hypothetical protein